MTTTDIDKDTYLGSSIQSAMVRFSRGTEFQRVVYTTVEAISVEFPNRPDGELGFRVTTCRPDPELWKFTCGGTVFYAEGNKPVGWARPATRDDTLTHVEVWSARVQLGEIIGYYRWSCDVEGMDMGDIVINGRNLSEPQIAGPVQPGSFSVHVESRLPDYTEGLSTEETYGW